MALVGLLTGISAADYAPAETAAATPPPSCIRSNPWEAAAAMNTPRVTAAAVAADGYVFVLGGWLMTPWWHEIDSVESAAIGADGALGAWTTIAPLTNNNQAFGAVAANGYVYVIGGWNGVHVLTAVERAPINDGGQLGPWEATGPLPDAWGRINLAAVITGTQLYVLGGFNYSGADVSRSVLHATLQPDGGLGPWTTESSMLTGRRSFGAVAAGNYIYVLGGSEANNAGAGQSVERAEVLADGSLGAWESLPALLQPRLAASALVDGGYLYALGGAVNDYQATTNTVERAAIHADGTLGPWQYVDSMLAARVGHSGVSYDGHFYLIGGHAGSNIGDYAQVNSSEQVRASDLQPVPTNALTINDGGLFTNQTAVTLTISGEPGTVLMQVSNDGGFAGAAWQDCVATLPWSVTQYGQATIPRVVYVKFKSAAQVVSGVYSDDIILDVTAPTGTVEMAALTPAAVVQPALVAIALPYTVYLPLISHYACAEGCAANVQLTFTATDDASGVGAMQIGSEPALTLAAWEPYAATRAWYLHPGGNRVYVRFRDNAGNVSSVVSAPLGP